MLRVAAFKAIFRGEKPKNESRPARNISITVLYITSTFKVTYMAGVTKVLLAYITIA
jgi:hypothetical protein